MEAVPRCPICYELIREPVVLPCRHEMCRECFQRSMDTANFYCPICRRRCSSWARQRAKNPVDVKRKKELEVMFEQFDSIETLELLLELKDEEESSYRRSTATPDGEESQLNSVTTDLESAGENTALQLLDEEEKMRIIGVEEDERLAKELSQQLQEEHQVATRAQLEEDRRVAEWLDRVFNDKSKALRVQPSSALSATVHHIHKRKKTHRPSSTSSSSSSSPSPNRTCGMASRPLSLWFKPHPRPPL